MKVTKVDKNEQRWFNLKDPVIVATEGGPQKSCRLFFNGYATVFKLVFEDSSEYKFTSNHRLKLLDGNWISVSEMKEGDIFNNGLKLVRKIQDGISPTMDMEVENEHHYILSNGITSHNSSFILGQISPSIEPENSCYYVKKLAKGSFTYKNPYLREVLNSKGEDTDEIWRSILEHGGSVQHLDFLSDLEKDVFKTFGEISQKEIVIQAAQRQKYIDQSQSLNIMVPSTVKPKEVSDLLIFGWQNGIKTFYYQRSTNPAQQLSRSILTCTSCEA